MRIFKGSPLTPEAAQAIAELREAATEFKSDAKAHIHKVEQAVGKLKEVASPRVKKRLTPVENAIREFKEIPNDLVETSAKVEQALEKSLKSVTKE